MSTVDLTGTIGVSILLLAYLFLLTKILKVNSKVYIWMNIIGAGLSTLASIFLHYIPFIILEGTWTLVSVIALFTSKR